MNTINIGLTNEERKGVVNLLNQNLADFYLLQIKTKSLLVHNFSEIRKSNRINS